MTSYSPKRLLLVHAHPDDESLFTGHVIADALAKGSEVGVLTLTRGERGKVKLAELRSLERNAAAMGAFRANELKNALASFGEVRHWFAGTRAYLDTGMRLSTFGRPTKPRRVDELSLSAASTAVISEDILEILKEFKPDTVVTYNRRGGFGHPDHKKAHEATAMALRHYQRTGAKPEFWVIAEPKERFTVSIGGPETAAAKKRALEEHASQVIIEPETYSLVPGRPQRYDAPERLRKSSTTPWLWLKHLAIALWALPLGLFVALAGTLMHQVRANDANLTPIGLLLALTMTGALALALRLLRNSRGALYLMAFGFSLSVLWLSQRQPGGEVFIPDNDLGNFWAYGGIAICAIAILFPRLRRGTWGKNASGHR